MITAKQNQKFPFHFLSAPPTPRRKSKRKEGKFLVFAPATKGSGRGAQISPRSDCFGKKFGFCSGDTAKKRILKLGWETLTRTKITSSRGMCSTIRRSPNALNLAHFF